MGALGIGSARFVFQKANRISSILGQSDAGPTIDMLNAMQQLMTGEGEFFDPAFLEELLQVELVTVSSGKSASPPFKTLLTRKGTFDVKFCWTTLHSAGTTPTPT